MAWLYLALAISAEVAGTLELRALARAANRWLPLTGVTIAYIVSFTFLALALRSIGVATAYAIWSGVGTAAVAVAGAVLFGERVSWTGAAGMALIVSGVVVLVASGTAASASVSPGSTHPSEGGSSR